MLPDRLPLASPEPRIADGASPFALAVRHSPIHGFGVFAGEDIPSGACVIEYTGERISYREAARRSGSALIYLFRSGPGRIIDGARGGSGAEFINHSCAPNLTAEVEHGRVYLLSVHAIAPGDELLFDYRLHNESDRVVCRCGAAACRGYLNAD